MLTQAETDILNQASQDFGSGVTNLGREANLFAMESFTLSVTMNLNSLSGGNQRVLWNHTQYGIVVNDDNLQIALRGADGNLNYYTVPDAFTETGWHDVQVTYDAAADALKFFLDGEEVYSSTTADVDLSEPSYWDVTAGGTLWGNLLDGDIADVSVLDSAAEIDGSQSIAERMLAIDAIDPITNVDVPTPDPVEPTPTPKTEAELLQEAATAFGDGTVSLGSNPDHYNLDSFTFSVTFSLDTLDGGKQMLLHSQGQYAVYVHRDNLYVRMRDEDGRQVRTRINDAFDETGWHDVQVIVDQATNEFKVFSDGELLMTKSADWISLGEGAFKGVTAGGNQWGNELQGDIADVSIHNEALSIDGTETLYDRMYALDDGNLAPKYEVPQENTEAVISGDDNLFIAEDDLVVSGKLDVVDPDANEAIFVAGIQQGEFGSLEIDEAGNWSYVPSSDKANALGEGDKAIETITVTSADGTSHVITVTIEGSNDVPQISGIASGYIAEEGPLTTFGKLHINDVDEGESAFVAGAFEGVFGTLVIDAEGNWNYSASGNEELVALGDGENAIDAISVMSVDGTRHLISINVSGSDSEAIISGVDTGTINENGDQFAAGKLDVADPDAGESGFKPASVAGELGVLTIDGAGNWNYVVSNPAAVDLLGEGDVVIELLQVQTIDGSIHNITIELQGANDLPVISGVSTGVVAEDGELTAAGKLDIQEADFGEAAFVAGVMDGTYGSLTLGEDGTWKYVANNGPAMQQLAEGASNVETFKVSSVDGTEHVVSVTVVGTNDAAVISGVAEGAVAEDGPLSATGKLNISDVDAGESRFTPAAINGSYGLLIIDEYGNWSYDASQNDDIRSLGENQSVTDQIEVSSLDGTTHVITISVSGSDSEAIITGVDTGIARDDGSATASGKLDVVDTDAGQSAFQSETIAGEYGALVIDPDGNWIYQANESTAFKALGDGETLTDTVVVRSVGGTEHSIAITLEGTDDAPIVSGVSTGTVGEDGPLSATGKLDIFDFDTGESAFIAASVAGDYGILTIDEAGNWSYDASGNAALEALGEGDVVEERLEVLTADGTVQEIVITVVGGDSEAVISGVDTGSVTEDSVLTASGKLAVSDKDTGQSAFVAATVTGVYGALVIDADGNWTYNADNSALQSLGAGDVAVENLTVQTVDGSTHVIAVDLQGTNDAAEITGTSTGTVEEDGNLTATGQLNITDADSGEASFQAGSINGAYGTLDIDSSGNWTYTANNGSNMQALNSGELATDSLKVYAADGTEHIINIAVKGQDEPVDPGTGEEIIVSSSAELLAALNNASGGEIIKLVPGDYPPFMIQNVHFEPDVTITSVDENSPAHIENLVVSKSSGLNLSGLEFHSLDAPSGSWGEFLLSVLDCEDIGIIDNKFGNDSETAHVDNFIGFTVKNSSDIDVLGNNLSNLAVGGGLSYSTDIHVEGNKLNNIRSDGMDFTSVQRVEVIGNELSEFHPNETDHSDAFQFLGIVGAPANTDILIKDNLITQSGGDGSQGIFLRTDPSVPFQNVTIENNIIYQSAYHGISVYHADGLEIYNNTVVSPPGTSRDVWIRAEDVSNALVVNNISNAISLPGGDSSTQIVSNNLITSKYDISGAANYDEVFNTAIGFETETAIEFAVQSSITQGADVSEVGLLSSGISTTTSGDYYTGTSASEIVFGYAGNDFISGEGGNDALFGGLGDDTIQGGEGDDVIHGGTGQDVLEGGSGADVFRFSSELDSWIGNGNRDKILDFNVADGDKISIDGIDIEGFAISFGDDYIRADSKLSGEELLNAAAENFGSGIQKHGSGADYTYPDAFTISAVFELNTLSGGDQYVLYNHKQFSFKISGDDIQFGLRTVDGVYKTVTIPNVIDQVGWHDLQLSMDKSSGELSFWLDGKLLHSESADNYELSDEAPFDLYSGGSPWGSPLQGQIADITITDQYLVPEQSMDIAERMIANDFYDQQLNVSVGDGSSQGIFDELTGVLSLDLDGDYQTDMEIELVGVKDQDLEDLSFLI